LQCVVLITSIVEYICDIVMIVLM